jgi:NAD(P)H-flavin reductase
MSGPTCHNPSNPWLTHTARIDRVTAETPGVTTYDLVLDDREFASRYSFQPGQFNMLYLPGIGEVAISVSGNPAEPSSIPHTIREAGSVTHALANLSAGQSIGLRGPFGTPWPLEQCDGKHVVLVAGGVGLAPLRPVIYQLQRQRDRCDSVNLLYGGRSVEGLLYTDQYADWRSAGIDVQTTVDRATAGWSGHVGVVTLLLDRLKLSDPENTLLLTCGPEVMMWYVIQTAIARRIAPTSIYVSLERHMNCAIGLCGHCQLGPEFVCKDGPVFRYDRVASIMKVDDL